MKLAIQKNILVEALGLVTPITDRSSSKPILSNFLLKAEAGAEGTVEFSATDYEISLQGRFPAQVQEGGTICISAKKALEICREFITPEVLIRSDDQMWVTLEGPPARLRLPSVDTGLYPQMEALELGHTFKVNAKVLLRCIELTLFASLAAETRKNLTGVCLTVLDGQRIKWTATDGHRLAQMIQTVDGLRGEGAPEIIVPRRALGEMEKVLARSSGDVEVAYDARALTLRAPGVVLTTRLVEGKFPNVDAVIPKDSDKTVTVNRERMSNALKIVSFMSNDKIKPVKLSLEPGKLRLETERAEYGDVADELPVDYAGAPFQIGFNARYLLDVLTVADHGQEAQFLFKGALSPCLIKIPGDSAFLSVVMPLRIEW